MRIAAADYSFLADPDVPDFEPPEFFTVMDAECGLCAKGALWIANADQQRKFRIVPMQSELGGALLRHYGMSADDPLSWLYIERGQAYRSLDAVIRVGRELGGVSKGLAILNVLPRGLQDYLYAKVARNRYRFLRNKGFCNMANPAIEERLLS